MICRHRPGGGSRYLAEHSPGYGRADFQVTIIFIKLIFTVIIVITIIIIITAMIVIIIIIIIVPSFIT